MMDAQFNGSKWLHENDVKVLLMQINFVYEKKVGTILAYIMV